MKKMLTFFLTPALVLGVVGLAAASIIGVPTLNGITSQVGTVDYAGRVLFFIPLDGSEGTYGDGIGTTADTVTLSGSPISGPIMHMYLYFPIPAGQTGNILILTFSDLDLSPYNNPAGFFERLILHGENGLPSGTFDSFTTLDSLADVEFSNGYPISITFTGLDIPSGDNWLHLGFETYSTLKGGTWTNTEEKVLAKVDSVTPEPSTLLLICSGLVGIAGARKIYKT